jgi:hypothetical protein
MCFVYWLHLPEHTDMMTEGYVGVTDDLDWRLECHKRTPNNRILKQVIPPNKDRLMMDVILEADKKTCFKKERELRGGKDIGWNVRRGGAPNVPIKKILLTLDDDTHAALKIYQSQIEAKTNMSITLAKLIAAIVRENEQIKVARPPIDIKRLNNNDPSYRYAFPSQFYHSEMD